LAKAGYLYKLVMNISNIRLNPLKSLERESQVTIEHLQNWQKSRNKGIY